MASTHVEMCVDRFDGHYHDRRGNRLGPPDYMPTSFELLYEDWLTSGGGLESVCCDYGTAVEVLLELTNQIVRGELTLKLPFAESESQRDSSHAWQFMTETGFRQLVFCWEQDRAKYLARLSRQEL